MPSIEKLRAWFAFGLVGMLAIAILRESVTQLGGLGLSANQLKTHADERALLERFVRLRASPARVGAAPPTAIGFHLLASNAGDVGHETRDAALLRSMAQYGLAPTRVVAAEQAITVLAVARDATTSIEVPAGFRLTGEVGDGCWWLERVAP